MTCRNPGPGGEPHHPAVRLYRQTPTHPSPVEPIVMCTTTACPAEAEQAIVFAPPAPGGAARQFRVQVAASDLASRWRLHASFRDGAAAHACIEALRQAGASARLVVYRTLPCAA